jgi:hypothetical protein
LAFPLQKNQLATPLPYCLYFARAGTSCSYCGSACYCCCARYKAFAVPVFEKPLESIGWSFWLLIWPEESVAFVTDEPAFCYVLVVGGNSSLPSRGRFASWDPEPLTTLPKALAADAQLACQLGLGHVVLVLKYEMLKVVFQR